MTFSPPIDPHSPIPLYYQIAEAIRARIEAGELAPGEALEPIRRAAESWSVNMHTVRHAYAALARDGLVERRRGPQGTRVLGPSREGSAVDPADVDEFIERVVAEASNRFGISANAFAEALMRRKPRGPSDVPVVWVVECSLWQCECHAREIQRHFAVDARPWPLDLKEPPTGGALVSTYFHYNDLRRLWPRQLSAISFLAIHPDPELATRLKGVRRVKVPEQDASTAEVVIADLMALLDGASLEAETVVTDAPSAALDSEDDATVLFTPRVWAALDDSERAHPRALELRYVFDLDELGELARRERWQRANDRETGLAERIP